MLLLLPASCYCRICCPTLLLLLLLLLFRLSNMLLLLLLLIPTPSVTSVTRGVTRRSVTRLMVWYELCCKVVLLSQQQRSQELLPQHFSGHCSSQATCLPRF
jgi:hypothetical protein